MWNKWGSIAVVRTAATIGIDVHLHLGHLQDGVVNARLGCVDVHGDVSSLAWFLAKAFNLRPVAGLFPGRWYPASWIVSEVGTSACPHLCTNVPPGAVLG